MPYVDSVTQFVKASLVVPTTGSHTEIGSPFALPHPIDRLGIIVETVGLSASTLDLFIQGSWDGGTTWYDYGHVSQMSAGEAASVSWISVDERNGTAFTAIGKGTSSTSGNLDLANNAYLTPPWPSLLRLVSQSSAGSNSGTATQTLTFCIARQVT